MVAGRATTVRLTGSALLGSRLLTKGLAFTFEERDALHLRGLLPDRVLRIEDQMSLELEHLRRKPDDLERYIGLAALQDRNATLFYRLLTDHLEEFLPIVYTPTVGRAVQEFSHILRRTRGIWITPDDVDRVPAVLRNGPYEDVRLIVVTDNERILGLGDQGAGGMAIPIGKLALYTAACGLHPALTLPVSLDVGTDNPQLLEDPLYVGHRGPRLRGPAYDALVEAFVEGVGEVWPGCLIQWEDFKQGNALRILDRYRDRVPSFNDDIQGTSAVVVAGMLAAARALGRPIIDWRFVLAGAGAAGIGIARLLGRALREAGADDEAVARAVVLVDSHGLVHAGRTDLDDTKRPLALPLAVAHADGLALDGVTPPGLEETIRRVRPQALIGTTGVAGTFTRQVIRALAAGTVRPVVLPLSNPTANTEATPAHVLAWSDGRALVATGSPFAPVEVDGTIRPVGQANNVFVFPGLGLGAIAAEARGITDGMVLAAARVLAGEVTDERLATGALYPPVGSLGPISRAIAIAVAREAINAGVARIAVDSDVPAIVDAATWQPAYVPYRAGGAV
jgi:malate dehydrogenase (oxaloacetate-decarboxylating)